MTLEEQFEERGLHPLQAVNSIYDKIDCIDADGYKYNLSIRGAVGDKRTKEFDKWSKNNPFKPYNMRLFASLNQKNVQIISTDEELREATKNKVKFICPKCGCLYEKKWCHWIAQEKDRHWCTKCSNKAVVDNRRLSEEEIIAKFEEQGFHLIEEAKDFEEHIRYACINDDGYKYKVSLTSLIVGNKGNNKFSATNPFAVENLQKYCDDNYLEVKVLNQNVTNGKASFVFQCACGNTFETEAYKVMSCGKLRCSKCISKESGLEKKTREWLEANSIAFVREYRFEDCRAKRSLPFDFKCDTDKGVILIEVDGGQHYAPIQWGGVKQFRIQKEHDSIKDEYCKENNLTLLRIPWWHFNTDRYTKDLYQTFFG